MIKVRNARLGAPEAPVQAALRNGTVTLRGRGPILTLPDHIERSVLSADASRPDIRAAIDLAGSGIGLLASPTDVAQAAAEQLQRHYRLRRPRRRGNPGRARRRWVHAANPPRHAGGAMHEAGVRHEPRHRRFPDERVAHRQLPERIAAAKAIRVAPLEMKVTTVSGQTLHPCRDQRSLAAARNPPDREDRNCSEWPRRAARACLRRRAGRDARRLDRLQS